MKIFVYTSLEQPLRESLRQQVPSTFEVVFHNEMPPAESQREFQSSYIIMGNPPVDWFNEPPVALAFWQLDSAGFDQYRSVKPGIPVSNMGDFFSRPCAETIVGGILTFYRHIHELVLLQAKKKWVGKSIRFKLDLLGDKKVIILGAGTIGQAVKQMLTGFGSVVRISARKNPVADFHSREELMNALPETDLVVNTLPGTAEKFVNAQFFETMKTGSLYASIGRGNTTDEQALVNSLKAGKLAGAMLDVTPMVPLPADSVLWAMKNVILTQHSGGGQMKEDEGKVKQFIANLNRFLNKEKIKDLVDLSRGY